MLPSSKASDGGEPIAIVGLGKCHILEIAISNVYGQPVACRVTFHRRRGFGKTWRMGVHATQTFPRLGSTLKLSIIRTTNTQRQSTV